MSNRPSAQSGKSGASKSQQSKRDQLRQQAAQAERRTRQMKIAWVAVAVVAVAAIVVGIVVGVSVYRGKVDVTGTPPNATADGDGIILNPGKYPADAPVFVLYQDFQCPACKSLEAQLGPKIDEMAEQGTIQLQYRTMTFLDTNLRNDSSLRAGAAAACADVVGHYSDYATTIYDNQPTSEGTGYTDDQLMTTFPEQAGITGDDLATFKSCYRSGAMEGFIKGTDRKAGEAGITGTPHILVNGKELNLQTLTSPDDLPAAVQQLANS